MDNIKSAGGSVTHHYSLFKGFSASIPDNHFHILSSHPHLEGMEKDGVVHTQ